jgi:DNA invertase Pin-like site-specific DNA recombinase
MSGFKSKKEMAMSRVAELAYDIEQMFIEGYSPKTIAAMLECPLTIVYDWLESNGIDQYVAETPQEEEYSPFNGA